MVDFICAFLPLVDCSHHYTSPHQGHWFAFGSVIASCYFIGEESCVVLSSKMAHWVHLSLKIRDRKGSREVHKCEIQFKTDFTQIINKKVSEMKNKMCRAIRVCYTGNYIIHC